MTNLVLRCIAIPYSSIIILINLVFSAVAQSNSPPGINLPPDVRDPIEETNTEPFTPTPPETPQPTPEEILPDTSVQELPPECQIPSESDRISIKNIEVKGPTVLQTEIAELIEPFQNRPLTSEELLCLPALIEKLYINNGYITSGAFLTNSYLADGNATIQVIEGEIEEIKILGLEHLKPGYVRSRLELATQKPLNRDELEETLRLLQLNPLLKKVDADLQAGIGLGGNVLVVELDETSRWNVGLSGSNGQSPSTGELQGTVFLSNRNLLGIGDHFSAQYGFTEGLNSYSLGYTIPFTPRDTTFSVRYSNNDSNIIDEDFAKLGIRSESETLSVNLRHPIINKPNSELGLSLGLDLRRSQTFILDDIPFSFSEGPEDGASKVTVIRFSQDWVDRSSPERIIAARSQFSFGIDAFGATINDIGTDGRFFSWLGQLQLVQKLSPRIVLVAGVNAQLTPDSLLSLEQFSLGGADTVRGYRQNQLVADNGILGTMEVRIPVTSDPIILQVVPFFDIGSAWNNDNSDLEPGLIASLGLGLRGQIGSNFNWRLDYGLPLVDIENEGNSLQEQGLHFSLTYQVQF